MLFLSFLNNLCIYGIVQNCMKSNFSYMKTVGQTVLVNTGGCSCSEFYSECNLYCEQFMIMIFMIFIISIVHILQNHNFDAFYDGEKEKSLAFILPT